MSNLNIPHIPVLYKESVSNLNIIPNGVYIDGTLGLGGHSEGILEELDNGKLLCFDLDEEAIKFSKERLSKHCTKTIYIHDDFKNALKHLDELKIERYDGLLLDLGVSSIQIDNSERGFSYTKDGFLDMRMDKLVGISALEIVNEYSFEDLAKVFREYGEEKYAGRIADKIITQRNNKRIEKTLELANLVNACYPRFHEEGNAAKRVFQALRIEVNQELKGLYSFLCQAVLRLKVGGRAAIISFHSLEDRIVKQAFSFLETDCICDKKAPICTCNKNSEVRIITKKPIVASMEEINRNPRAKSAKLRIVERI